GAGAHGGAVRVTGDGLRAGAAAGGSVPADLDLLPVLDRVAVAVCGGGTGGAPAGIAAARAGARTAVVELMPGLGGVSTLGQICRYWYGNRVGFTHELDHGWPTVGKDCADLLEHCRRSDSWNPEWRARWLLAELAKAGGTAWFACATAGAVVADARVAGALVAGPWGCGTIEAGACVDASGSADLAAAAGAATETIGAEHVAVQGTGLGPKDPHRYYRNTDHTFVDDNDLADTSRAHLAAAVKFAGAFDLGQLVDSRERRRIRGEVTLQPVDFLRQRRWNDTIVQSTSNFDTHGFTVHPLFLAKAMHHRQLWVDVPLRALLPRGLEGVLVTGLGLSSHRDALPVIRMQPDVQNQGYAAGRIAALAAAGTGGRIRAVDLRAVQKHLAEIGNLDERVLVDADGGGPDRREVEWAVAHGLDLHLGLGIVFDRPDLARPLLRAALAEAGDPARRQRVAMVLGLCGDPAAAPALAAAVAAASWDEGWNYRGMGQFGMSASPVDALVVALGACAGAEALPALTAKIAQLGEQPYFSHCRALAEALRLLRARGIDVRPAATALAAALAAPGMAGHAEPTGADAQRNQTGDGEETAARNRSLRELTLAAALRRCGDHQGLGARTLRAYADDLRGHYRRHALAVLAEAAA
ncbi:MAG: FAD-dependent oxidoreductase, partial [Planctomycetes bacterium]|nr:FAD-dependent oxidoreductase [Planctomycetota bacterium]